MSRPRTRHDLPAAISAVVVRAFVGLVTGLFYPLRVQGWENLPSRGGVLLISNHVSYVDWLLLQAAAKRPVRFLISKSFYESPWLNPFVRVARVIPIPSGVRPREVRQALGRCGEALRHGEVVCVFAEGGLTRSGQLMPFQRGFEMIIKDVDAPIVPVALAGMWGSLFSFEGGRALWKCPRRLRRAVTVSFGRPLPPTAKAADVCAAVAKLLPNASQPPDA